MTKKQDARVFIHTPAQLSQEYVEYAEQAQNNPGVSFGIQAIDRVVVPMRPGNLTCVIARPGHGKSSWLALLAKTEADRIVQHGAQDKEAVVFVTFEQSAEELESFFQSDAQISSSDIAWGRADIDAVKQRAVKRAALPIWIIGHGIGRAAAGIHTMTLDLVLSAIESMQADFGIKPTLLLIDYLQLIPVKNYRDRVQQVTEAPILVKQLALRVGVPTICAVQAGREVDNRSERIPEMQDAQWASSIEQTADKIFSIMRPCRYFPGGGLYEIGWLPNQPVVPITEELCVIRLLKQRLEKGRYTWLMHFAPQYLRLTEMEYNTVTDPHSDTIWTEPADIEPAAQIPC